MSEGPRSDRVARERVTRIVMSLFMAASSENPLVRSTLVSSHTRHETALKRWQVTGYHSFFDFRFCHDADCRLRVSSMCPHSDKTPEHKQLPKP